MADGAITGYGVAALAPPAPRGVVVSGDRTRTLMAARDVRLAVYDGRLSDLGGGARASFAPLISSNWNNTFTWQGVGEMPADQRATLRRIVATAHADGQRVRFWATPDLPGEARPPPHGLHAPCASSLTIARRVGHRCGRRSAKRRGVQHDELGVVGPVPVGPPAVA